MVDMTAKEPWEMTREDYLNKEDEFPELPPRTKLLIRGGLVNFDRSVGDWHKRFVTKALSEGRPVPAEVLKDYPDLDKVV